MDLHFNPTLALQYKSPSQKIRVLTENRVRYQIFCPSCGNPIKQYENNKPVADFYCQKCKEEFELKSKKEFSLQEVYSFERELRLKYPNNRHIKDKIRQQLQFLRDKGYLEFLGQGKYRLV